MKGFLITTATETDRRIIQEKPIRDDPDSNGWEGEIIREGLKHEEIIIEIKFISSGDCTKYPTQFLLAHIMKVLAEVNIEKK